MPKLFTKKWIFSFLASFFVTFMAGFFIWNIFISPGNGLLDDVLAEVNKISSGFLPASISSSPKIENTVPNVNSNQNQVSNQNLDSNETLLNSIEIPDQNLIVMSESDIRDQLDDIQEKLDVIKKQVADLLPEDVEQIQILEDQKLADLNDEDKKIDEQEEKIYKKEDLETNKQVEEIIFCTGQININTALIDDLDRIIQIGPATAQKIIEARPFYSLSDLEKVDGIGEITLQKIIEQGCAYVEYATPPINSGGGGGGSGSEPKNYPKILISEVQISPIDQRFIELYNPTSQDIDLTNWYLQRKTSDTYTSFISKTHFSGKTIKANDYFLISRSDITADIVFELTLTENNFLALKNPNKDISDEVSWSEIADGLSWCNDFSLCSPTFKEQNVAYVEPPVPTLENIAVTTPATKLIYNVGDALDIFGLVVTGTYSDESELIMPITLDNITGFDSVSPSNAQVLTITVEDKTTNYPVDIIEKSVEPPPPTDTTPPEVIFNLEPSQNNLDFTINFTITDSIVDVVSPSGLASYIFRWQEKEKEWNQDEVVNVSGSSASGDFTKDFIGEDGKIYNFQIQATDVAGNTSDWLPIIPATVIITIPVPPPTDITPPTGTIEINSGAQYTNSGNVILTFSATDDLSGVVLMNIANYTSYHGWETYSETKAWTLSPSDGNKTVRVKFKDSADNETSVGIPATIILDTKSPVITLIGDTTITLLVGSEYTELGAITDDGSTINIAGTVDNNAVGTYNVIYTAIDAAGNQALPVTRTVVINN
jgi:DNA uptake protein ComE-like DNA-binding protein